MLVREFNGVFHGDNVTHALVVQSVDDARECGGLTRASWARDQHQSFLEAAAAQHFFGNVELLGVGQAKRDNANHRRKRATLAEDVRTETPHAGQREGEVIVVVQVLFENLPIASCERIHAFHERQRLLGRERTGIHAALAAV